MAYLGQRTFASFEKKVSGWGEIFEEDEEVLGEFFGDIEKKKADENTGDKKTSTNDEKWFTFYVPVSQDLDAKQSHIHIYMYVYKVAEFRAEEILRDKLKSRNSQSYASLWESGKFTEFTEEDVKRGYKAFSFSYKDLLKYASYTIEVDEEGEKVKPEGFEERRKWFDSLADGTPEQQETRRNIFRKADERFKEVTGKDKVGNDETLKALYLEILDEIILTHNEGWKTKIDRSIRIQDYWERTRTNAAWDKMSREEQDEYKELLDYYRTIGYYNSDPNYTYEEHLNDYTKNRENWYKLLDKHLAGHGTTLEFIEFLRNSPSYRLRYIPPTKKISLFQYFLTYNWDSGRHFAKKVLDSMEGEQLTEFQQLLAKDNFKWLKYFESNRAWYNYGIPLLTYMKQNGQLAKLDIEYRKKLLKEQSKSIGDSYGLGMEQNIIDVITTTPDNQLAELFEALEDDTDKLLYFFYKEIDWDGFKHYSKAMVEMLARKLGPKEMYSILKYAKKLDGSAINVVPFEKGSKGNISYKVEFDKESYKIKFSYTEKWSELTGRTIARRDGQGGSEIYPEIKSKSSTTSFVLNPLEPVYIQFGGTNSTLGVKKGHMQVVPAIYLLYIDSEEFKSLVFNTILTVIEVGLLLTGVGAIASGTLKGARLVLAIADIVISAADMFIRAFEDEIYDMEGGPEFLKYWNYTQMMIGLYGVTRVIKNAPETISDLSQSWRKVKENLDNKTKLKNIDGDNLKNFEKSIDDFDDALKDVKKSELENLDETIDVGKDVKKTDNGKNKDIEDTKKTNVFEKFTSSEREIIIEVKSILNSSEFDALRKAAKEGRQDSVKINGRTLTFEPDIPSGKGFYAITNSETMGFHLGIDAFQNQEELIKTLLHELHRLKFSDVVKTGSANKEIATFTTKNANDFANEVYELIFKIE